MPERWAHSMKPAMSLLYAATVLGDDDVSESAKS